MKKNILTMAALLIASATVFTACSNDDNITGEQPANPTGKYTMTVNASKDGDATTRALTLDETTSPHKLNATWDANEVVLVYQGGSQIGTLHSAASTTNETTLTGELDSAPDAGKDLTLYFHMNATPSYAGQDGTLATIASTYDFCAPATITAGSFTVSGSTVSTTSSASFGANQQAIVKFTLKDKATNEAISTTELVVSDGTNTYTITPASATSEIFVAIPGFSGQTVTINATINDVPYTFTKSSVTFANGQYYAITVSLAPVGAVRGGFTVNNSGNKVYFSKGNLQATTTDKGTNWTWAFATNQYDYVGGGKSNTYIDGNGTVSENGTVDLFGWSTENTYYGINNSQDNTTYSGDFKDWGEKIGKGWRTLTSAEWQYVFNTRTSGNTVNGTSNARYTSATINTDGTGVNGLILFPDGVTIAASEATSWGTINGDSEWGTKCTAAQWTSLEAKGCVFLPAAGRRNNSFGGGGGWFSRKLIPTRGIGTGGDASVDLVGQSGYYWSSTLNTGTKSYGMYFEEGSDWFGSGSNVSVSVSGLNRYTGSCVRLVFYVVPESGEEISGGDED